MVDDKSNIILIGMPGVGKSTVGVLLAKATHRQFLDTDVMIQVAHGRSLQEIIDTAGTAAFLKIEEDYLCCLDNQSTVIATGGSAVYSARAMAHLRSMAKIVYLRLDIADLVRRLDNLKVRGVVMTPGQSVQDLFAKRRTLYERYADITVDCDGLTQDQVVAEIMKRV